ncbi:Uncharacterized protein HSRCO_0048 [Halanaeroarchaeum sp. HSR-CO]|nr:Uncharacterized protein HSRCO_0048 [Halanaeroarchaeum sp. HSR-CO]
MRNGQLEPTMTSPPHPSHIGTGLQDDQPLDRSALPGQGGGGGTPVPDLRLAVVRYDDRPDRGTIHPSGLTGLERMETWISVDMSLVADLSTCR